ncbi:MAG: GTPase ObgE, partial [Verrucomicrobiae bacterium]|nr:GTPase ObgE [Verrucomicrobiae bacterium]
MFVDEVKVFARAGHGGRGAVAFHREAYIPKGGPSGGNGGRGGNVILEASHDLNNLIQQFYQPRLLAESGEAGMGKGMDGLAGRDLVIKVPCGTLVWRIAQPPPPPVADSEPGEGGGAGGAGGDEAEESSRPGLRMASAGRPVIRSGVRALEIDLESGGESEGE